MPISEQEKSSLRELLSGFNTRINTGRVIVATEVGLEDRTECPNPAITDRIVLVPCPTIGDLELNFDYYPDADKRLDELADHHLYFLFLANNPGSTMTFAEYRQRAPTEAFSMEMYGYIGSSSSLATRVVQDHYIIVYKFVSTRDREVLTPSSNGTNFYEHTTGAVGVGIWTVDPAHATFGVDTGVTTWIATGGIGLSDRFMLDRRTNGITGPVNAYIAEAQRKYVELTPVMEQSPDGTWESLITPQVLNYPLETN